MTLIIFNDLITKYFELATSVPLHEIDDMGRQMREGANPRDFKMRLGRELVTIYHSREDAIS